MRIIDDKGRERDFFLEVSKYAGFLYRSHLERHLAIYELYKKTLELPGSVAEFGVYNGSTFYFLSRLIEIFNRPAFERDGASSNHLYGFDIFTGITELTDKDESLVETPQRKIGGFRQDPELFFEDLEWHKASNTTIAGRMHIIRGDVAETFPRFVKGNPGVRFRFVLMDMDLYAPTALVLQAIIDYMVPGSIIAFDEYAIQEWPGESAAVDQFIKSNNLRLRSIPWAVAPAAYCVIE
jgi:hypothetical protein